jgi:hypothetical protein
MSNKILKVFNQFLWEDLGYVIIMHISRINQVQLLLVRQLFYLSFTFHGFRLRVKKFNVSNSLRSMHFGVSGAFTVYMKPCPRIYVFGIPRVEATIRAQKDIDVEGHLPLTLPEVKRPRNQK